jgi:hypothetical protein
VCVCVCVCVLLFFFPRLVSSYILILRRKLYYLQNVTTLKLQCHIETYQFKISITLFILKIFVFDFGY